MKIQCPKCGIVETDYNYIGISSCLVGNCDCVPCPNNDKCGMTYRCKIIKEEDTKE